MSICVTDTFVYFSTFVVYYYIENHHIIIIYYYCINYYYYYYVSLNFNANYYFTISIFKCILRKFTTIYCRK